MVIGMQTKTLNARLENKKQQFKTENPSWIAIKIKKKE